MAAAANGGDGVGDRDRQQQQRRRLSSSGSKQEQKPYYVPTLTERRPGEAGIGARSSEAGLKIAVFGASGFLGNYVCSDLGAFRIPALAFTVVSSELCVCQKVPSYDSTVL